MFYIYRNLHQGDKFSVRRFGRVIIRLTDFEAFNVHFSVSEPGRLRVIREHRKNVHAFVVAERYSIPFNLQDVSTLVSVKYNPYTDSTFKLNGEPIHEARRVIFTQGRCYVSE